MSRKGGFILKGKLGDNLARAEELEGGPSDWELRPGGMLVQRRDPVAEAANAGPFIRVKISYGRSSHHVSIAAHSTFGDLKKLLVQDTGLQLKQQRLLYKGKEKTDHDCLHEVGVKDKSKIVLVEDITNWEKRLVELRKKDAAAKACKTVAEVKQLIDHMSGQIATIEAAVVSGRKLLDGDFTGPTDLLMGQLIKLDASKVDGDDVARKRMLVRRVQKYVETLDALKARNDSLRVQNAASMVRDEPERPQAGASSRAWADLTKVRTDGRADAPVTSNNTVVTTTWETFGSSTGNNNGQMKSASPASEPLLIQWD